MVMRSIFLPLISAYILTTSHAFAITAGGKEIVDSITYFQNNIDLTKTPFTADDDIQSLSSTLESQYGNKLKTVQERLAKVSAADRTDPSYVEKAKWAEKFDAAMKSWRAEAARLKDARTANMGAEDKYKEESRSISGQLEFVKRAAANTNTEYLTEELASQFKKASALDGFVERCKKEYASLSGYYAKEKSDNCAAAQNWRKVVVPYIEARAKVNVAASARQVDAEINNITTGQHTFEEFLAKGTNPDPFLATLDQSYTALFTAIGRPKPADLLAPVKTAIGAYPAAIGTAVTKFKYKAGGKTDATVTAAVKKDATGSGVTVLKVSQNTPDWSIKKEGVMPKYRYRDSSLLAQVKGEKFCRLYTPSSRQEYAGGGKYSGNTSSGFDRTRRFSIAACK